MTKNKECIQSISKGDNSRRTDGQMTGQTDAQETLYALCTSSDGHLSMYQVSFNSLLYYQRYAPDKVCIAKINTRYRVMALAFCNSHSWPSVSVPRFIYLSSILLDIYSGKKYDGRTVKRTDKMATICSPIGEHKNEMFFIVN